VPRYARAKRTHYWQYDVPVKVGMSLSVLASARKMSDEAIKEEKEEKDKQLQK
jgi:hypothetical protein